jgi:predicted acylesterase/phospholipase RssA
MPVKPANAAIPRDPILVDLALQGGGSHGAFTWGVLDRLLEEPWLGIDGISGTSAGAMNAAFRQIGNAGEQKGAPEMERGGSHGRHSSWGQEKDGRTAPLDDRNGVRLVRNRAPSAVA